MQCHTGRSLADAGIPEFQYLNRDPGNIRGITAGEATLTAIRAKPDYELTQSDRDGRDVRIERRNWRRDSGEA